LDCTKREKGLLIQKTFDLGEEPQKRKGGVNATFRRGSGGLYLQSRPRIKPSTPWQDDTN